MLSKIARTSHLKRASLLQHKMAKFSTEVAKRGEETDLYSKTGMSWKDLSTKVQAEDKKRASENSQYFNMLAETDTRQRYFTALAGSNPSDHGEVKKVKNKINSLIE